MIATVLLSFGVLFVAELGDKSQLMALTFALRYRWWIVLSGIAVASVAVNLIAAGVGHFLGAALPTDLIAICTGVVLLVVGLWTLRETLAQDEDAEVEKESGDRSPGRAFLMVLSAFLLAELGDRTMFATIALSSNHSWLAVWTGSVLGMVAAGALAIGIGITVGKHLPERLIATGSGLLFLYIGAATLLGALIPGLGRAPELVLAALAPVAAGGVLWLVRRNRASVPATVEDDESLHLDNQH
ncbi:putative Ca2+/H+ antiporter (TMEM165/GDT1 family) [Nocardia transvalensis]|uniref:GDT1 family protein n=1 Tax=Nocardia transvalensis TaxID=37333 RepID=A0A7W9UHT6_9NOCA|nr:TMEM165/GDT1 family protein [Nocardia transvalensis]MBB5913714.1 putative Ca2+/H+ antiporter (TMEM165/GDT1 family) [Nocardia transvalensis]